VIRWRKSDLSRARASIATESGERLNRSVRGRGWA
jgi:hypothetical protein